MKKIILLLLVFLLAAFPLLAMTACNRDDPADSPETIALVEDGVAQYRIVRSDFANGTVKSVATGLRNAIGVVTGTKPDLVTDYTDENANADIKEILIGKTNRPESSDLINRLSGKEYGYEVIGNKIVIVATTDALLEKAVAAFLKEYAGYVSDQEFTHNTTITIPANLSMIKSMDNSRKIALYTVKDNVSYLDALYKKLCNVAEAVVLKTEKDLSSAVFDVEEYGLVVVAGADTMPYNARKSINSYLENGGRVLFLGGPTFNTLTYEFNGMSLTSGEYADMIVDSLSDDDYSILLDTTKESSLGKVSRSTDVTSNPYKALIGDYGLRGSRAQLYHEVNDVNVWDMLTFPVTLDTANNNCFAVYAKPANEHTTSVSIELKDKNGARWYTNLTFESDDWQNYVFFASDFRLYQSKAGDTQKIDFNNIVAAQIGYATSFGPVDSGKLAYCISDPIICHTDYVLTAENFNLEIDTIAPLYEQYPITNAAAIVTESDQAFVTERDYCVPTQLFSCHPGRQGAGFDKKSTSRFIPLLRVTDEKGLHSGYAAWIELFSSTMSAANGALEGSMVGCFSASSEDFYNDAGLSAVAEAANAMIRNIFIVDGGTTEYLYVEATTDKIELGVNYVMLNDYSPENMTFKVDLYQGDKIIHSIELDATAGRTGTNNTRAFRSEYDLSKGQPTRAVTTLVSGGKVLDMVEHDIRFWSPKPASERSYVYIEDGYFKKDGKILNLYGVNYLPSYNVANYVDERASLSYYNAYCADQAYDPEVIGYDLEHIKNLGFNAISFSANGVTNNLLDLIVKCEDAGLYIDLSINSYGVYPLMGYDAEKAVASFEKNYLAHFDSIVAYDIAWEHRVGSYNGSSTAAGTNPGRYVGRQNWDTDWVAWINLYYGSVAAAQKAWGTSIALTNGVPVVTDEMLDDTTNKYQKIVAAYYRFLDDQIAKEMLKLNNIQPAVANQLLSFRMSASGSAIRTSSFTPSTHCFDFQSLATSMAFMQPEGYQLGGNDTQALQIMFANAYARYTNPDSPVVWKEFGKSVWSGSDDGNFRQGEKNQQSAAMYYKYTLDYCYESYTSGMFCWFYAGGYRVGEKSDYGILNPDGSDRPLTAYIREYASKFINQGELNDVVYIEVERDDYVGGLFGMYEAVKDELAKAYAAGKSVTFINASQGKDGSYAYADTLLDKFVADAVSDSGIAPLRYVNGMIEDLTTYTKDGKTYAKVTLRNTKQSTWRAGTVSIASTSKSRVAVDYTITQDVEYLEVLTVDIEINGKGSTYLRFRIGDVEFGSLYTCQIP